MRNGFDIYENPIAPIIIEGRRLYRREVPELELELRPEAEIEEALDVLQMLDDELLGPEVRTARGEDDTDVQMFELRGEEVADGV